MTRRGLVRLLPLLAVYLLVGAVFPPQPDDEAGYLALAQRLTEWRYVDGGGDGLLDSDPASPDLWFGPGLPLVLVPAVALDLTIEVTRLLGPALLFAAMLAFFVLCKDRFGERAALVGTYAVGLYPPFWPLLPNLHSEPLAILLLTLAMLGIARYLERPTAQSLLLAAGGLAGLALTRVAYGWVVTVVLALAVAWSLAIRSRPARRLAAVCAVAMMACVPWLVYTEAKTNRLFQWGNSGALSLYWMSSPHPGDHGDWRQASDVFTDPRLARHRPLFDDLRGLSLPEQNVRLERAARRNIADHPGAYLGNILANASRMVANAPYSDSAWEPDDLLYGASNTLLLGGVMAAAVVLGPRRRSLPPETGPFLALAVVGFGVHLLVASYPRMLSVIVPLLGWFMLLTWQVRVSGARGGTRVPTSTA